MMMMSLMTAGWTATLKVCVSKYVRVGCWGVYVP